MARIRTIKPSFFRSLTVTELPKPTRLTWLGLWTYADDAGRGVDDARLIKAELWPLDDDYTAKKVEKDMELLEANGSIRRYVVEGRRYFAVVEWKHQRIDKPTPSVLPAPPSNDPAPLPPDSESPPGIVEEASVQEKEEGLGREVEEEPVDRSSSSLDGVGDADPEEEDHHGQGPSPTTGADHVAHLVAERRWSKLSDERRPPEGIRRERWTDVTAANLLADEGAAANIRAMLAGGCPVESIVDAFEPPERPAPPSPSPSREQLPPAFDIDEATGMAVPVSA